MAARVAAIRRFLADSRQELHEVHRSRTPDRSRRNLPLLGHRVGCHRAAGNAWKVRLLKSLSRRWAKSAIANQSRLTACVQIERPVLEGTSVTRNHPPPVCSAHRGDLSPLFSSARTLYLPPPWTYLTACSSSYFPVPPFRPPAHHCRHPVP